MFPEKNVLEKFARKQLCFRVLAQLLFTTSDTKLHNYQEKVNALDVRKFRKLENFKKICEMLRFTGEQPAGRPIVTYVLENRENHSIEKPILC